MSRNKSIAIVAVVLLAAGALWLKTRGGSEGVDAEATQPVPTKISKAQADSASKPGERKQDREVEVLFDDDPEGTLRLEGQVITRDQLPVAGAMVSLDSRPPRFAKTEEDGSFFFDKLVGRNYDLVARAEEGVAGPVTARLSESNEPVILTLSEGGTISVKVVSKDKPEGISGASVELRSEFVQNMSTDPSGQAVFSQVPVDRFTVVAWAEGYAPMRSSVSITRPGAATDVQLELKSGARVAGIVLDPDGKALEGARVIYQGASDWSVRADTRHDGVDTDAEGRFSFPALPKGSFRFTATAEGFAPGSSTLVELSGSSETTGVEIKMEAGATLRGVVLDSGGEPVRAARVRVGAKSSGMIRRGRRGGLRQAYTDDTGSFEITGLQRKPHELVAVHDSATSQVIDTDLSRAPHEQEVEIVLDIDGMIAGIVVDSSDEPVAGAQVMVFPDFRKGSGRTGSEWRLRGMNSELTDAGGRFRVGGLKADVDYRVRAVPSGAGRGRAWLVEGVEARAGDDEVRVVLPKDGGIKGKVAFADGEAPELFTVSAGWQRGTPFSSKDGSFELTDLPPQELSVTISGPGMDQRQVEVEVKEGEIEDLGTITVSKGRFVAGTVVDGSGSPVAGATVSAGRVIFGDGSSAQSGGGARNPMARNTKAVVSDESGIFRISGIGLGDLSVVADHESAGRSLPVSYRQTSESVTDLQLVLQRTGALQGTVRKSGTPEPDIVVTASSVSSPGVTFNVGSGPDGTYRFDRLVADTYRVKAMYGGSPMAGMGFAAKQVEVSADKTVSLDLEFDEGGAILSVTPVADGQVNFVRFTTAKGEIEPKSARELDLMMGASTGYEGFSMSIAGRPAKIKNLKPGTYSVCAVAFPSEVRGMGATMDYIQREGDNLPAQCQSVNVTEEPEQAMEMQVVLPEFVPAPNPAGEE